MAKNIYMHDPFDVLTGNLGSKQDLRYREHDNKAYEAPDGIARAKNYRTRYVGVRRADGTTYFMVKKKSTANLNNKTRTAMALLGSIAAIKSALMVGHSTDWANLHSIYNYRMAHGGDEAGSKISFDKWLNYWLRQMLQYKQSSNTLTASGISVVITNPFNLSDYDISSVLAIATDVFRKFNPQLCVSTVASFTIDGVRFDGTIEDEWKTMKNDSTNPNYIHMWEPITAPDVNDAPVQYNGKSVYTSAGVAVKTSDTIINGEKYTTITPSA